MTYPVNKLKELNDDLTNLQFNETAPASSVSKHLTRIRRKLSRIIKDLEQTQDDSHA